MKCKGSGIVLGGWRKELEGETVRVMCTDCWRKVDAVPIAPEPRTDLRKDGALVWVSRKQIVDHEAGNKCLTCWRKNAAGWFFMLGFTAFSLFICVIKGAAKDPEVAETTGWVLGIAFAIIVGMVSGLLRARPR